MRFPSVPEFLKHNSKMAGDGCVFKFLRGSVVEPCTPDVRRPTPVTAITTIPLAYIQRSILNKYIISTLTRDIVCILYLRMTKHSKTATNLPGKKDKITHIKKCSFL